MLASHQHSLSNEDLHKLAIVVSISASLSLLGSIFIIFTFLAFKAVRKELGAQLVFFLNLSDFCMSVSWYPWWGELNGSPLLCTVQASTLQYFEIASVLWAFCIALTLVMFFNEEDSSPRMSLYHLLCWSVPIPIVAACLYLGLFGNGGATWCWIKNPQYRFFVYIPCFILALSNFILFLYVIFKSSGETGMYYVFRRKIFAYLIGSFICVLPALANRLQNWIQPHNQMFLLFFLQAMFQPLQGFINSIIYGLTDDHYMAEYRKWKLFRQLVTTSSLNINAEDDEVNQPLTLEFDYENGSYKSFPKIEVGTGENYKEGTPKSPSLSSSPTKPKDGRS